MAQAKKATQSPVVKLELELERDVFLRNLLRELTGTLEEVVGLEEASGFVGIVGQHLGEWINHMYQQQIGNGERSLEDVANILVDLKRRINGDFYIISVDEEKIVLGNRVCPFGDKVRDRPSLCMMTSNVFGTITADNLGYAKVVLQETIARGDKECRVVIHLKNTRESEGEEGNEFYRSS